jgi:hypothetical protein
MVLCDGHYCICTIAAGRDGVAADAKRFGLATHVYVM